MIYAIKLWLALLAVGVPLALLCRSAFDGLLSPRDYAAAWLILGAGTSLACLSLRTELFMVLLVGLGWVSNRSLAKGDSGRVAILILLGIGMPAISWAPSGFGDINRLLEITPLRALVLGTLLPCALRLAGRPAAAPPNSRWLDRAVLLAVIVHWMFNLGGTSASNLIRQLAEATLDTLLPYYVISRSVRTEAELREVLSFFVMATLLAAAVALAEVATGHLFYSGLQFVYGIRWQLTLELFRGSFIRTQAMTQQPILLAVLLTFGLAVWLQLKGARWRQPAVWLVLLMFAVAIVSTGSRGPLLGLILFLMALFLLHRVSASAYGFTLGALGAGFALAKIFGWDDQLIGVLQAVFGRGEADTESIDYRRALFDTGLELLKQEPWWGVSDYAAHMQHLRQGEGIIDLVNTYIGVALEVGLVGLAFFFWPYLLAMRLLARSLAPLAAGRRAVLGTFAPAWLALMSSMLFTLFSTSLWGVLEFLLVIFLGLTAAWVNLVPDADPAPAASDRLDTP